MHHENGAGKSYARALLKGKATPCTGEGLQLALQCIEPEFEPSQEKFLQYLSLSEEEGKDADSHMHSHRGVG